MTTTTTGTEPLSLDDILRNYDEPGAGRAWRQSLYVYEAPPTGMAVGKSLTPIPLGPAPVDESEVWRSIAARLGGPGRVIVRLQERGGEARVLSAAVDLTAETWQLWRGAPAPAAAAPRAAPAPVVQAPAPAPAPSADVSLLGLLMQSMQQQQALMMQMMTQAMQPRTDPAVEVLKLEIERLNRTIEHERSKEKDDKNELMELGKKLAGEGSGMQAAATVLAGPIDKLAGAMAKAVETRTEIELRKAETQQMLVGERLAEKGLPVTANGGAETTPTTTTTQAGADAE